MSVTQRDSDLLLPGVGTRQNQPLVLDPAATRSSKRKPVRGEHLVVYSGGGRTIDTAGCATAGSPYGMRDGSDEVGDHRRRDRVPAALDRGFPRGSGQPRGVITGGGFSLLLSGGGLPASRPGDAALYKVNSR